MNQVTQLGKLCMLVPPETKIFFQRTITQTFNSLDHKVCSRITLQRHTNGSSRRDLLNLSGPWFSSGFDAVQALELTLNSWRFRLSAFVLTQQFVSRQHTTLPCTYIQLVVWWRNQIGNTSRCQSIKARAFPSSFLALGTRAIERGC